MTKEIETTVDSRVYEVSYIFDNKIEESTALLKVDALKQSIATLGGSFVSEETPYLRELAYEMIRVVNNVNIRFNEGYFGWIKFEMAGEKIKDIEKTLKADEEVVRFIVVKTVKENTVFTKRAPVVKAENLTELIGDVISDASVEEVKVEAKAEEVKTEVEITPSTEEKEAVQ